MRKQSLCSLPGHLSIFCGELRIPHWTKQISRLASVSNVNWMPSLSLIASPLQVYWQRVESARSPFTKQTRPAWLRIQQRGLGVGVGAGVFVWFGWFWNCSVPPHPPFKSQTTAALSLMKWSPSWSLGEWVMWAIWWRRAGVNQHMLCIILYVRCGCSWGGIHLPQVSIHHSRKWPVCW